MQYHPFLKKGGELGELTRAYDWSLTSLGAPDTWSQSLLTSLNIVLTSKFPMLLFWGADLITFYNDAFRPSLGIDGKHPSSLGQPGHISWAESWPVIGPMIHNIMAGGEAVWFEDQKLPLYRDGKMGYAYWTYSFSPVLNDNGSMGGVLVTCSETTKAVESTVELQQRRKELQDSNDELASLNEELAVTTKELTDANERLTKVAQRSENERERLNKFFMQAPAGICILSGPKLVYELVNPGYQMLLPGRALEGRPIFEALPELVGTPLQNVLLNVYRNNEPITIDELLIPISEYEGGPQLSRYFSFHYMPRKNVEGQTDGILAFVYEVTDQVLARQNIEQAKRELQLVIDSASAGTWSANLQTDELTLSARARQIHGVPLDYPLTLTKSMELVQEGYRNMVTSSISALVEQNKAFTIEYVVNRMDDSSPVWLRSTGMVDYNIHGKPFRLVGCIFDISESKKDEQRKNDFIGMVSHEMKTPLTSLSVYLQLLQMKRDTEDAVTADMLGKANKQVTKLTNLINGFLNVSRLESGKIHIDRQRFDMAQLVKEAEEEVRSTINSHQVIFAPVEATWVIADHDKIGQVISNLISNAVKYSPANTLVKVACKTCDGMMVVSVTDEGIGIKEEDQPKLFDRYYRVSHDMSSSPSGFGIGLYLCAEIIQRHDGKIWVDSEVGKGSTFSFSLPVVA